MVFSANGTFLTATPQTVVLTGTGKPTTQGANVIPVTGAANSCNITVNVDPAPTGAAAFTVNCATAVPAGTYTEGVALTAGNTITVGVTVATAGTYSITTTANNGMTFTAAGSLALTTTTITLTPVAGSTPTGDGTFNIAVPGTPACSFSLVVDPAVTSIGTWSFKEGTNTFTGTFSEAGFDNTIFPPFNVFYMGG